MGLYVPTGQVSDKVCLDSNPTYQVGGQWDWVIRGNAGSTRVRTKSYLVTFLGLLFFDSAVYQG